jgi:hypothetical protein
MFNETRAHRVAGMQPRIRAIRWFAMMKVHLEITKP